MSVQAAYRASMEGGFPSKEDIIWQRTCKEWIWEFLLKHCFNSRLLRELARAYPIPDSSLRLKRLLLLKSLSFDLSESSFTDRTLETLSALCSHYNSARYSSYFQVRVPASNGDSVLYPFSLSMLHLAVRVECTVQYLRPEMDDWPKFYDSIDRHWGNDVDDTQEPERQEFEDEEVKDTYLQLKEELWAVLKQPELRHDLLKLRKREYVMRMMNSFLDEAWKDVGFVFLEGVALDIKKGLYVPEGFALNDHCGVRDEAAEAEKSLPVERIDVPMVEGSREVLKRHGDSAVADAVKLMTNTSLSLLAQNTISSPTVKHMSHEPSDVAAGPTLNGGNEQTDNLSPRKRKMPLSLQRGKTELKLPSSRVENLQTDMKAQLDMTRSSIAAENVSTRDLVDVNGSLAEQCRLSNNVQLEAPGEKGGCLGDVNETCSSMERVRVNEGGKYLEKEEQACISPPPWAGSPSLNEVIIARKRPLLAPLCLETSKRVASLGGKGILETPVVLKAQVELKNGQANLNAVVQDPLPEAMRISEEASKISRLVRQAQDQTFSANQVNQQIPSSDIADRSTAQDSGAIQGLNEKGTKKSLMDRNPTAHTVEWETGDDIADSSDDKSPSNSRHVRLPKFRTRQSIAHQGRIAARNEPHRRKFRRWNTEEEDALRKEVERYGKGHWKHILQKHKDIFEGRTEVDLKDKWRNIERREGIP